jgi:hypothetical protein
MKIAFVGSPTLGTKGDFAVSQAGVLTAKGLSGLMAHQAQPAHHAHPAHPDRTLAVYNRPAPSPSPTRYPATSLL